MPVLTGLIKRCQWFTRTFRCLFVYHHLTWSRAIMITLTLIKGDKYKSNTNSLSLFDPTNGHRDAYQRAQIQKNKYKHRKNCESCPTQVTWKIKFKCQICLSSLFLFDLSVLSVSCVLVVLSFLSCLSWWSWWPWWHRDYHDDHDQGCINCAILLSGIGARGVSSEHMENMEMFSCSTP